VFECSFGAVLAVIVNGDTIYAGCQDGHVKVLDLETKTLVRTIIVEEVGSMYLHLMFILILLPSLLTSSLCQ
jgi:hypothetical protein